MGTDKFFVLPYKKGLLKRIYAEENRKQYLNSQTGNNRTAFQRGGWSNETKQEEESSLEFRVDSEKTSWEVRSHRFRIIPERGVFIVDEGSRYNWGKEDPEADIICSYFDKILRDLTKEDNNSNSFNRPRTTVFPDWMEESEATTSYPGDVLDDVDVAAEIPEPLRTESENLKVIARYGPANGPTTEDVDESAEAALYRNDLDALTKKLDAGTPVSQDLLYAAAEKKNTAACETLIERGAVADQKSMDIALKTYDDHTVYLLLDKGAVPSAKQVALAGVGWLEKGQDEYLFHRLLISHQKQLKASAE